MTNLEFMKKKIISQIEEMNVIQFENLIEILRGESAPVNLPIDTEEFFCCKKCHEVFGECKIARNIEWEEDDCSEKFMIYCNSEKLL